MPKVRLMSLFPVFFALFLAGSAAAASEATGGAPADQRATVLDEITVTAQLRESRLQAVPVVVTAVPASEITGLGLATTSDLETRVPNLQIDAAWGGSNNPNVFLRGVGTDDVNPSAATAVAIYADETYLAGPSQRVLPLFDLERVEVLHGPQGTLYGSNTTGGAIRLITRAPRGQWSGQARADFGNFSHRTLEGGFDMPLPGDGNGLRLALLDDHRDGLTENLFDGGRVNDIDTTVGRLRARIFPRSNLSLDLRLRGGVDRGTMNAMQMRGLIDGGNLFGYVESEDPFQGSYNRTPRLDIDRLGAALTASWVGPRFTVTSISSWETSEKRAFDDADASPNQVGEIAWNDDYRQFSQELRATSSGGGRFDWIIGAFYFRDHLDADNSFDILRELRTDTIGFDPSMGIFVIDQVYTQETESFAPFAHSTFRLGDRAHLRIGLRHTWETRSIRFNTAFDEPGVSIPLIQVVDEVDSSELSGGLGIDYAPSPSVLCFVNVRRGFKSGGFNGGALFSAEEVSSVAPERVTSLEAGTKVSWRGGRTTLGVTVFSYDYDDMQVFNFVNAGGVPVQILDNAAKATVRGLEMELRSRLLTNLELALSVGLLDANYDEYRRSDGADFSGNRLIQAPRWDFGGRVRYTVDRDFGSVAAWLGVFAQDEVFFDPTNNPDIGAEAFTRFDARISLEPAAWRDRVTLALWGKNLADERYVREVIDVSNFGFHKFLVGDPRTYGIEVVARF